MIINVVLITMQSTRCSRQLLMKPELSRQIL
jgi:hypothetical protein